jgi:hypothetical protein
MFIFLIILILKITFLNEYKLIFVPLNNNGSKSPLIIFSALLNLRLIFQHNNIVIHKHMLLIYESNE